MGCQPSASSAASSTFLGPSAAINIGMRSRTGLLMSFNALPRPVPLPAGSGIVVVGDPHIAAVSRRHTWRQISMTSRVRAIGAS